MNKLNSLLKLQVQDKVVPVFFKCEPRHEGILGWRYSSTHSLTSSLDGGEWSAYKK